MGLIDTVRLKCDRINVVYTNYEKGRGGYEYLNFQRYFSELAFPN